MEYTNFKLTLFILIFRALVDAFVWWDLKSSRAFPITQLDLAYTTDGGVSMESDLHAQWDQKRSSTQGQ